MDSDHELMRRVREGDSDAFAELIRRYRAELVSFFTHLAQDANLADDLTQEVFIRLWGARERYEPTGKFPAYLFRIARNLWLNERDKRRRCPPPESLEEAAENGQLDALEFALADLSAQPEEVLLARERRRRIRAAIDALPDKLQLVFVLGQIQGHKYREIAEMLRVPVGTVKYRMFEAVRRLREELKDEL
jgi:RNA polymerase sigma-70 factor (ECF subfamily)